MLGCASGVVCEDSMGHGIETAGRTVAVHRRQTAQTANGACEDVLNFSALVLCRSTGSSRQKEKLWTGRTRGHAAFTRLVAQIL